MAKVEIVQSLFDEIQRRFKGEAHEVIDLLESLERSPKKGKELGNAAGLVIKEIKYKSFRFYFITDGYKIKAFREEDLADLLIRFVRMSDKKSQQKVIDEIRNMLIKIGSKEFL